MSRHLLIRCKCEGPVEQVQEALRRILNVQVRRQETPVGESFLFSSMGIDGAIYESIVGDYVKDRRLFDHSFVLDVSLYATLTGRMYSEVDSLHEIALFLASFITSKLGWPTFVCTEEHVVMDEVNP